MDSRIQNVGEMAKEAFIELNKIQTGKHKILKTGIIEIDSHIGGLLPGDICTICSKSGGGKSHKLYEVLDNMLDVSLTQRLLESMPEYTGQAPQDTPVVSVRQPLLNGLGAR